GNHTEMFADGYSVEVYLHEMLAISPHRTFDPEEADFFYVPVYYTCFMWPINGWADMPFWGPPTSWARYANAAHMWLAAKKWIQSAFPFWDRRGGRDHIFMANHDEGACYMPTEIYKTAIMLTHCPDRMPVHSFPHHTDAVATIIQWLHSRIRDTRGAAA
ncbi:putative beta-1,4-xylosyltransferase IRX10L, partial [Tetrabaena socialis]